MKKLSLLFSSLLLCLTTLLAQQDTPTTYILLKNATIIDCVGDVPQKGDLLIKMAWEQIRV